MVRIRALLTPQQNALLLKRMERHFVDRRAQLDKALEACAPEIEEHCADVAGPPFSKLGCLMHQRDAKPSEPCSAALQELPPPPHFIVHTGPENGDVLMPAPPQDAEAH